MIRATRNGSGPRLMPEVAYEQVTSLTEQEAASMTRDENASGPEEKRPHRPAPPTHMTAFKR